MLRNFELTGYKEMAAPPQRETATSVQVKPKLPLLAHTDRNDPSDRVAGIGVIALSVIIEGWLLIEQVGRISKDLHATRDAFALEAIGHMGIKGVQRINIITARTSWNT